MANRVCMAIVENEHILMVQQKYRDSVIWTLPGGSVELGETPLQAVVREVKEEVNVDTIVRRLLVQRPRTKGEGTYFCYLGEIIGGKVALGYDPEREGLEPDLLAVAWFVLSEVPDHEEIASLLPYLKT